MKLFISADIEGCAGVALAYETHKNEAAYGEFAKQMTRKWWLPVRLPMRRGPTR